MVVVDKQGRAYAVVADTKAGDVLIADGDFDCIKKGAHVVVSVDADDGLYVPCKKERHDLAGQLSKDGTYYVGFYPQERKD